MAEVAVYAVEGAKAAVAVFQVSQATAAFRPARLKPPLVITAMAAGLQGSAALGVIVAALLAASTAIETSDTEATTSAPLATGRILAYAHLAADRGSKAFAVTRTAAVATEVKAGFGLVPCDACRAVPRSVRLAWPALVALRLVGPQGLA